MHHEKVTARSLAQPAAAPTSLPRGISVVVPVYDSADILPELVARLEPVLAATGMAYELILVDDGSKDGSWAGIRELAAHASWIRGLCMMRNYGQHNALLAGIRAANFSVTITMDDDLQHPPEELPKLLVKMAEGFDVVYGPPMQKQHGLFRNLASVTTKLCLQGSMGAETARLVSPLRVFKTDLRDAFASYGGCFVNIDVLLTWSTTRFGAVFVRHNPRARGQSNYTIGALARHALNMMTGFSVLPLQLSTIIGFGMALFGVGVLAYVLGRYLITGSTVAGFPFLASIIAIFSGTQLFALGIIGEYLARMHFRLMEKPTYAVKEHTPSLRS